MEEEVLCEFQNSANLMLNSKIDNYKDDIDVEITRSSAMEI